MVKTNEKPMDDGMVKTNANGPWVKPIKKPMGVANFS
jgi:hypothetical protein